MWNFRVLREFTPTWILKRYNLRFIFHKYDLNYKRVHMYRERDICNIIVNKWKECICREDVRVGLQIRKIAINRDSPQQWILSYKEAQDILEYLCTT